MSLTTDPKDPRLKRGVDREPGPQNEVYLVLSEEERAKGFVRPYRDVYRHVGTKPKHPLRDLTPDEIGRYAGERFVKFEVYPASELPSMGRFWTQQQLDNRGCGQKTSMGRALSETYARDPQFYGATYCCTCRKHFPVEEFVWDADGEVVGS